MTEIQAETLKLLEWQRLCQHLSTFAATKLGAIAAQHLVFPQSQADSEILLAQTVEMQALDGAVDNGVSFEGIGDISDALERATVGGLIAGKDLLLIATTLAGVRRLRRLVENAELELPQLTRLVEQVRTYPELEQDIHHCIDDRGDVTDRASPKLEGIRVKIKGAREQIYQTLQRIMQRHSGSIQEAVITQRGDRFVLPVKAGQKEQIPGIVHDISSTGSTLYIEPKGIVELGNRLRQAVKQEEREIEIVLRQLTEKVAEVVEDLEKLLAIATTLDLAMTRARYSLWLDGHPPKFIAPDQPTVLRQLRHPLLVWQEKQEESLEVIPINVQIRPEIRVVAITGPNTGGKTVTLKTLGMAALMAKVGLFIPAIAPVEIPWFDQVLADIGDEQSLQQSLSTFSGHIRRVGRIIEALDQDNQNNLVLLDEVGAGTDPTEGSALAIALLKYLADQTQLTVATTHYGELKALKYEDERFENASVEFDEYSLRPTYKLLWGIPGRSNALAIAQRLGLDAEIVETAQDLLGNTNTNVNEVIAALEAQRREQEQKAKEAEALLKQTERFYTEVSSKAADLQRREAELKLAQDQQVQAAIAEAKAEIAQVIRTLQKGQPTAQKAQAATEALGDIAASKMSQPKRKKPGYQPQLGEKIRISKLGQTAEVIELDPDNKTLVARFGVMKMSLDWTEIESLQGQKVEAEPKPKTPKKQAPPKAKTPETVTVRTTRNTIDIRGQRMHQAESSLEQAIANATAAGSQVIWIIHGKGTGKLREGVHEFLKYHPQIQRYELADQKEGGAGVTLAYFS
ncbi:endonuclease MutS2 [Picosynechococcus sp. PCC 11901]|uniref:endonuclease MutS2 n=1 Tax=Picosynechococcus sp. PCC 11901 TaxID=2579791 RepID=UPI0010FC09D5|nr:endonuclease MutS2 [Picosynechococcus sp. PCC 11901]QCS48410.1 endonuclease MutS2 [Picosynechococcus sp. PCC 11901]